MSAETNDLDTRAEDKARTEGRLAEFWEEEREEARIFDDTLEDLRDGTLIR